MLDHSNFTQIKPFIEDLVTTVGKSENNDLLMKTHGPYLTLYYTPGEISGLITKDTTRPMTALKLQLRLNSLRIKFAGKKLPLNANQCPFCGATVYINLYHYFKECLPLLHIQNKHFEDTSQSSHLNYPPACFSLAFYNDNCTFWYKTYNFMKDVCHKLP